MQSKGRRTPEFNLPRFQQPTSTTQIHCIDTNEGALPLIRKPAAAALRETFSRERRTVLRSRHEVRFKEFQSLQHNGFMSDRKRQLSQQREQRRQASGELQLLREKAESILQRLEQVAIGVPEAQQIVKQAKLKMPL